MIFIFLIFSGAMSWILFEYTLHALFGHRFNILPIFLNEHQLHHIRKDYFAATYKKVMTIFFLFVFFWLLNLSLFDPFTSLFFPASFVGMYMIYEKLHYLFHMSAPRTKIGLFMRKHHFIHHFGDSNSNHAVSLPILDLLFKIKKRMEKVPVPRKLAMNWLLMKEGDLDERWSEHFYLA